MILTDDWAVRITFDIGDGGTEDLMFALLDDLHPTHGASVAGWPGQDLSVLMTIYGEANGMTALEAGWDVLEQALFRAGAPAGRADITGVEVMTTDEQDRELERPQIPPLAGISDIADHLGISRQRALVLSRSDKFPNPVADTRTGSLWLQASVEHFARTWERRRTGRPRATKVS